MSVHDAVFEYQCRLVAVIDRSLNKRAACREAGIHHSTYYRWRARSARGIRPVPMRGRRWRDLALESQVVAVALAHPGYGPRHVADELQRMVGVSLSGSTVWRILKAHRLNTKQLRYDLMTTRGDVTVVRRDRDRGPVGVLHAESPGDLVQMDCFHVGAFKETKVGKQKRRGATIWQYTAIDVASSFLWIDLAMSPTGAPDPARTTALAYRVATDLRTWDWEPKTITTDNGNEFRAQGLRNKLTELHIAHRFIRAGRPQSNGKAERVQGTLLEEFYKPVLSRYVQPSITGLRLDLDDYVTYYNWQRPHYGKWNQGQPPAAIIQPKEKLIP